MKIAEFTPVIAVLTVMVFIILLSVLAGHIFCGRKVMGYGGYFNLQDWVERKCSSCIDGRITPPPPTPPPPPPPPANDLPSDAVSVEINGESKPSEPPL